MRLVSFSSFKGVLPHIWDNFGENAQGRRKPNGKRSKSIYRSERPSGSVLAPSGEDLVFLWRCPFAYLLG